MIRMAYMCLLTVVVSFAMSLPARSQILNAVGEVGFIITSKSDDIVVLRANGRKEIARPYLLLYAGDTVVVNGANASAQIRIAGDDPFLLDKTNRRAVIPSGDIGSISSAAEAYVDRFRALFSAESTLVPIYTVTRGEAPEPLSYVSILPPTQQFLPNGTQSVTAVWRGLASTIGLSDQAGSMFATVKSDGHGYATVEVRPSSGPIVLLVSGPAGTILKWSIVVKDADAPRPSWLPVGPLSERQRVARDMWLLRDGPAPWHMFAIGELASLSVRSYVAWRVWHAVKAGEL